MKLRSKFSVTLLFSPARDARSPWSCTLSVFYAHSVLPLAGQLTTAWRASTWWGTRMRREKSQAWGAVLCGPAGSGSCCVADRVPTFWALQISREDWGCTGVGMGAWLPRCVCTRFSRSLKLSWVPDSRAS